MDERQRTLTVKLDIIMVQRHGLVIAFEEIKRSENGLGTQTGCEASS